MMMIMTCTVTYIRGVAIPTRATIPFISPMGGTNIIRLDGTCLLLENLPHYQV